MFEEYARDPAVSKYTTWRPHQSIGETREFLQRCETTWRRMSEALGTVVRWALAQPEIFRVWATCDVDNAASARVLERVGMQRGGTLRRWLVHPNVGDTPRDCLCYAIVK